MKKPKYPRSPSGMVYGGEYSKPYAPNKPREKVSQTTPIYSRTFYQGYVVFPESELEELKEALSVEGARFEIDTMAGDATMEEITLDVYSSNETINPFYDEQMKQYKEDYAAHKEELAWWKECKKTEDAYKKAIRLEKEQREYERLKKKFE